MSDEQTQILANSEPRGSRGSITMGGIMQSFRLSVAGQQAFRNRMFKINFSILTALFAAIAVTAYISIATLTRWYIIGGGIVMLLIYAFRIVNSRFDLWELRLEPDTISIFAGETANSIRCRVRMARADVAEIREERNGLALLSQRAPYRIPIPRDIENYEQLKKELQRWRPIRRLVKTSCSQEKTNFIWRFSERMRPR